MIDYVELVLFGVIAALSPIAFAATLAVIRAGRLRALAFASGFVTAQFVTCMALVRLGDWSLPSHDRAHSTLRAVLTIGFGLWVLSLAPKLRSTSADPPGVAAEGRSQGVLERLGRLHSLTTLLVGIVLGVGVPRRFVITALAAASIAASAPDYATKVALGALYSIVASVIVWLPVIAFMLVGERAIATIDSTARWIMRRQRTAMFYALILVGAGSVAIGVARVK